MSVAPYYSLDRTILSALGKHHILRFAERRRCLNAVFWQLFSHIENSDPTLLVLDDKGDLEYLNYFLYKYNIQNRALILNGQHEEITPFIKDKILKAPQLSAINNGEIETAEKKLHELENELSNRLDALHEKHIGNLNLINISDKLQLSEYNFDGTDFALFGAIKFEHFRNFKSIVAKANGLYKNEFKYNSGKHLFDLNIFSQHTVESIVVIIEDLLDDLIKFKSTLAEFETKLLNELEAGDQNLLEEVQNLIFQLSEYFHNSNKSLSSTDKLKTQELRILLNQKLKISEEKSYKIDEYQELSEEFSLNLVNKRNNTLSYVLDRMTRHNEQYDTIDLFDQMQLLLKKIDRYHLFKNWYSKPVLSIAGIRKQLLSIENLLHHGIYFLNHHQDFLEWQLFRNSLNETELRLIDILVNIDEDWQDYFEFNYLKSYIRQASLNTKSISLIQPKILKAFEDFESKYGINLSYKSKHADLLKQGIIKDIIASNENWVDLKAEDWSLLFNAFNLIIVDKNFYEENANHILPEIGQLYFINENPEREDFKANVVVNIFAYHAQFNDLIIDQTKSIENIEYLNVTGTGFNINRSKDYLNHDESSKLAFYMAQGIEYFNSDYHIFQSRETSLLSLLSPAKNAQIISMLAEHNAKEIFVSDEQLNLIPGLITDEKRKFVIYLEDGLLNINNKNQLTEQLLFVEKLKIAGIEILNFDNYELIKFGRNDLILQIQKLFKEGSHQYLS